MACFKGTRQDKDNKRFSSHNILAVGDKRAHENPALLSLSIMFMRYHNAIAEELASRPVPKNAPKPSDRYLFETARSQTVAVLQVGKVE